MKKLVLVLILLAEVVNLSAQQYNIIPYLKQIEQGQTAKAEEFIKAVGSNHNNPDLIFLQAVLTADGESALAKYLEVYNQYPSSKFADAALFRIFSYYYALGYYTRAESYLSQLKEFYPGSAYIAAADREIPDEDLTVETDEVMATPKANTGNNFTIQAGAFLNPENAKKLSANLTADGYECEIKLKDVGGTTLNVVIVGKYETREQAERVIDYLLTKHKINSKIASLDQYK